LNVCVDRTTVSCVC